MLGSRSNIIPLPAILVPLGSVIMLTMVDYSSVLSYFYTLALLFLINRFVIKEKPQKIFIHFHYYLLFAVAVFAINRFLVPNYIGLTGPAVIGTDDTRYYAELVEGNIPYSISYGYSNPLNFTLFLKTLYIFPILSPLNIVIFNLLGIVFLPSLVNRFTMLMIGDDKIAKRAEILMLICPFITYYGCIIMRDIWVVSLAILALCYYIEKRYIALALSILLIIFIRFGSLAFLGVALIVIYRDKLYRLFKSRWSGRLVLIFSLIGVVAAFIFALPYLQEFTGGKLEDGLFRSSFILKLNELDSSATVIKLMLLPIPLNIVALTSFFFLLPFLSFELYHNGVFLLTALINKVFAPIFFFFLWRPIGRAMLYCFKDARIRSLVYIALLFSFCLGTISLQYRHKAVLMPILCILAAIGYAIPSSKYKILSSIFAISIIAVQLIFMLL